MHLLRTRAAYIVLVMGLLAWVWGLVFQNVHSVTAIHVRCDQHDEVVEYAAGGPAAVDLHDPEIGVDHDRVHPDHHCVLQGIQLLGTPTIAVLAPSRFQQNVSSRQRRPTTRGAPRGPPLDYAPKTSPPAATA